MYKVITFASNPRRPHAVVDPNGKIVSRHATLDAAVQICLSENAANGTPGLPPVEADGSGVRPSNNRGLNPPPDALVIQ